MQAAPDLEDVLKADCQACFGSFEKVPPRRLDEGLDILLCSECHVTVHKCCYDFQPSITPLSDRVSQFLCERCAAGSKAPCVVCQGTDGAMKAIGADFVHVYCGLVHNDVEVVSYYPSLRFRKSNQYDEVTALCEVCGHKNAHEQCADDQCRKKVHTYCARAMYVRLAKDTDEPHSWNHQMIVGNQQGNHANFDLGDEIVPYEIISDDVDSVLKEVEDKGFDFGGFKNKYKQRVYQEYQEQQRSRRKATKKLRRGGFSFVTCPLHTSTVYCFCGGKSEGEMVLCECCFEWYHHKCVGYEQQDSSYVCRLCRLFYEFKRKALQEVRGARLEVDLGKVEYPIKVTVADLMWGMRVIDCRIRGGMTSKMLKQLNKYPLKSSCMEVLIRYYNRNKLALMVRECLEEMFGGDQWRLVLLLKPVLRVDASGEVVVLGEGVAHNGLVGEGIDILRRSGVDGSHFAAMDKQLHFKQQAVTDQYDQIIELSKTQQDYHEVSILKQKAQAYTFQPILKRLSQKLPVTHAQLSHALTQAQQLPHPPLPIITALQQKLAQTQPIIDQMLSLIKEQPQNYKITQLAQSLQEIHIEPPAQYAQLSNQKKTIQELYLYMIKQTGGKLEESVTIPQQLQQLVDAPVFKPSQELTHILEQYSNSATTVWPETATAMRKAQHVSIQHQLKEMISRRYTKVVTLQRLLAQAEFHKYQGSTKQLAEIVEQWKSVIEISKQVLEVDVSTLDDIEDMLEASSKIEIALSTIKQMPFKFQDQTSTQNIVGQLRQRGEEIDQLKIIFTESQLERNPLSQQKLVPSLPKSNPLVKQYIALKKEQTVIHNKIGDLLTRINLRLEYFKNETKKLQRKEQMQMNSDKPALSQVTDLLQQCKHSHVELSSQIRELTRIVNNSLQIAGRVKKYVEEKGNCQYATLEELSARRKEIDELRKKVLGEAQVDLKSELVELYHSEIVNRMRTSVLSPNIDLQKMNTLLKFAEEEALTHLQTYKSLKQKFDAKNQKTKEVSMIRNYEASLAQQAAKDTTGYYGTLYAYRKKLPLTEISEAKTKNYYFDDLIEKNKQLRVKLAAMLRKEPARWEWEEAKGVFLQALKNPYFQPDISNIAIEMARAAEIRKRWKEIKNNYSPVDPIFKQYDSLIFRLDEMESVKEQLKLNEDDLKRMSAVEMQLDENTRDSLEDILERIENNSVIRDSELCRQGQEKYIKYWLRLMSHYRNHKFVVPFDKAKRLLLDAYAILQRLIRNNGSYEHMRNPINELQEYMIAIKSHVRENPPPNSAQNYLVEGFIDLEDLYLDHADQGDLIEAVPLLTPFLDLTRFRLKNLQRLEQRRDDFAGKRSREKLDDLLPDSEKHISVKDSPEQEELPKVITDAERRKIKEIFLKNIRKNPEFRSYGECHNEVRMIENQIFGDHHDQIEKYFEKSEQIQKLFVKLISCPNFSSKVAKKKFEFKFIQSLVNNLTKLDELEGMVVARIKEQEAEKTISNLAEAPKPVPIVPKKEEDVIDEDMRQDLKKEIKMIKESKNKKHKHKHKHHRSHSRSPEAKFSSDSDQEAPSYIQKEYNKDLQKETRLEVQAKGDSPIRYDPDEEEMQKKETIYPKGSLLQLKTHMVELHSKRKGKMDVKVRLMTEQDHRKIVAELFDPGFTKLVIRKDKSQGEIIQYLNRSKKKYKYLVCWWEAQDPTQNEILRDIAAECSDKKKIYGFQMESIKVHIMSINQVVAISKFHPPGKVSSKEAAETLKDQRLVAVLQYPERIYEVRDQYKSFEGIQKASEEFQVNVPAPLVEAPPPVYDYHYTIPTIEPLPTPQTTYEAPKMVYEGGWGNESVLPQPMPPQPEPMPMPAMVGGHTVSSLPYKINQVRMQFGFGNFSPILTDEEDEPSNKKNEDLAGNLLNELGDIGTKLPSIPSSAPSQPQKPPQQQPYQGYYGGYGYGQQPPRPQQQPRWGAYPSSAPAQSAYNPIQGGGSKYNPPPPPPPTGQSYYKNPMMTGPSNPMMGGQRSSQPPPPPAPPQPGQYYRQGDGYDRNRYQGGYQQ